MRKGNVLVIGNSGVGKSTLINAVLGENAAKTGYGIAGTSRELHIYENEEIPFRVIDTVGFEPTFFKERQAINAVKKWSHNSTKTGGEDTQINVIWVCVDGTSRKLFPKTIKTIANAISMWSSVPIIAVITKSYSLPDRDSNIEMVKEAFATHKKCNKNLSRIIPVVASTYVLNENAYAAPEGIMELIDATNDLLPEGIKAAEVDVANYKLSRKRVLAHSVVGVATAAATIVGAVPIPFSDAFLLGPCEVLEVNSLAQIYGVTKDEEARVFLDSIIDVGTVGAAAKLAISGLKSIPGINLGASVINAAIAGSIVAAIGEGSIYAFEQVYLGKKSLDDIEWVKGIIESHLSSHLLEKAERALRKIGDKSTPADISKIIYEIFFSKNK